MSENLSSKNFTLYPLFWLAICFAFGIVAANFLSFGWLVYSAIGTLSAVSTIAFIKQKFVPIFLFVAFAALGALYFQVGNQTVAPNRVKKIYDENRINSGDPIEIEGVLQSAPELAVGGFFLTLKTEKAIYKTVETEISGSVRLFAAAPDEQIKGEYEFLNLNYGSRIRVACRLRRENSFLNAGVISQTEILDGQGIDATAIIKSPLLVEKIGEAETFVPLRWIYRTRQKLTIDFRDNFNVSTSGVLIASLLGNDNFLDKRTAEVFRDGGTFHVLVISGLHITFIGGLTLLFIQFFTNKRLWQFVIANLFLWSYALAGGANVPVVRATIMFTILLFSQVIYRNGTLLNALGLCGLILLAWRPNDVFTPSFQLTFASVGAIILTAFPLIEKLRLIGSWSPSVENPFPPKVPVWLKRFCEMFYWREQVWEIEVSRQLWTVKLFKSPYLKWLEAKNLQTVFRYIFEAMLVSLIVQAWLLPLSTIYFHRFSWLSVFLNLWVGVVIALESFAAIFAVFLVNVSGALALPFVKITEMLNWLLVAVPNFFTENSQASVRIPHYSGAMKAVYILYFAPLIYSVFALNGWKPFALNSKFQISNFKIFAPPKLRFAAFGFLSLLILIVFHPFSAPTADGRLHIDFLDVGQGDSALLTFPNGETLLVDGGGRINFNRFAVQSEYEDEPEIFAPDAPNIGEMVVSNFLWAKGYSQIDYILATHADADHIQGLSDIAENFRVRTAIFARTPLKNAEFAALDKILQKRGIESAIVSRGDVLTFDDVKVEVLYPEKEANAEAVSNNNHSLVLRIDFGMRKFLLTGDIEKEAEKDLLNAPEFLAADVIKVAHHGSRTSSIAEFVNASKARLAIIPVGRKSPFGHPHSEVVERWKTAGAKVLTTGDNGTISVSTDGKDLQLKTFE
ncbi:MAG: ComEC/Rec2 family competence protein [Pyrinomonadaceae bacterium]|nr:ComEC/Rec2 family competence protein [Pyrinomonadaceae bacterium]